MGGALFQKNFFYVGSGEFLKHSNGIPLLIDPPHTHIQSRYGTGVMYYG